MLSRVLFKIIYLASAGAVLAYGASRPIVQAKPGPQFTTPALNCEWALTNDLAAAEAEQVLAPEQLSDIGVELEMDLDFDLLALFTTHDQTVAPALAGLNPPRWLAKILAEKNLTAQQYLWDDLSLVQKLKLLRYVAQKRDLKFLDKRSNRIIPGLRMRKVLTLYFSKPTQFLGRWFEAGEQQVDLEAYIDSKIEYRSPSDMKPVSGVEIHFRRKGLASDVSNDAETLQKGLGLETTHQHVHLVQPLPIERLITHSFLEFEGLADYLRRINLVAEMLQVLEGYPLTLQEGLDDQGNKFTNYEFYEESDYAKTLNYLRKVWLHYPEQIKLAQMAVSDDGRLTHGSVALRASSTYDQPLLYGLEVRFIDPKTPRPLREKILNSMQYVFTTGDYIISGEAIDNWLVQNSAAVVSMRSKPYVMLFNNIYYKLFYNNKLATLIANANPEQKNLINRWNQSEFTELVHRHQELKMLIYRWHNDIITFNRPDLLRIIEREQLKALTAIYHGADHGTDHETNITTAVAEFLKTTKLFDLALASVGAGPVPETIGYQARKQLLKQIVDK